MTGLKQNVRNRIVALLLTVIFAILTVGLVACNPAASNNTQDGKHKHKFSSNWTFDDEYHWQVATCEHTNLIQNKQKHTFENDICTVCKYDWSENFFTPNDGYVLSDDGKYAYFGYYPQSEVTDTTLVATLNKKAKGLPTSSNLWTDYGYYQNGVQCSYMWYIDIVHNRAKYRGVYFTSIRPNLTSEYDDWNSLNDYDVFTVYWFKFEPLKWRVLSKTDDTVLLMCDSVIDSQAYQLTYYYEDGEYLTSYNNAPKGTNAFNYQYSAIRLWLNDNFYNTAFTDASKQLILTTEVDNSEESTLQDSNRYACDNTNDKVFLLSNQDLVNTAYGFYESMYFDDTARKLRVSAYAMSQGATMIDGDRLYGVWWLRSPCVSFTEKGITQIYYNGCFSHYNLPFSTRGGVVPAIQIQL